MLNSASATGQHVLSRRREDQQCKGSPNEEETIPFVDSDHEDACRDGSRSTAAISSCSAGHEDDTMTQSQEDLGRSYVHCSLAPTLAERRMQEKLTVSIEYNIHDGLDEEAKDEPTVLKPVDDRARGLRRNSISLPSLNVNEMEALRLEQQELPVLLDGSSSSSLSNGTTVTPDTHNSAGNLKPMLQFNDETSSDEEDRQRAKNLFRTKRRSSIAPLPALRLNDKEMMSNDFDTHSVMSNQASITSINSLASLLKEKMQISLSSSVASGISSNSHQFGESPKRFTSYVQKSIEYVLTQPVPRATKGMLEGEVMNAWSAASMRGSAT